MLDLEQLVPKSEVFRVDEIVLKEKFIEPCRINACHSLHIIRYICTRT